jgi:hypothetical protein
MLLTTQCVIKQKLIHQLNEVIRHIGLGKGKGKHTIKHYFVHLTHFISLLLVVICVYCSVRFAVLVPLGAVARFEFIAQIR